MLSTKSEAGAEFAAIGGLFCPFFCPSFGPSLFPNLILFTAFLLLSDGKLDRQFLLQF